MTLAWGGRSITLAQVVLEHGSATVGFEQYRPVLEATQSVLPPNVAVTLLLTEVLNMENSCAG